MNHAQECPLHLYLQHHYAWITPLLTHKLSASRYIYHPEIYEYTHKLLCRHILHAWVSQSCSKVTVVSSGEIIVMITKAALSSASWWHHQGHKGGVRGSCWPESYQASSGLKIQPQAQWKLCGITAQCDTIWTKLLVYLPWTLHFFHLVLVQVANHVNYIYYSGWKECDTRELVMQSWLNTWLI